LRALSAEELARRSQQGCRASFAELVERYAVPLRQFLHHQTNHVHDAEDLVQDTFVRAYGNIDRYRSSYKFSTWLFTIARRLAISRLRSLRRPQVVAEAVSADPGPREAMAQRETKRGLWDAARGLSANQYWVLRLRYAEDLSIKEIAQVMGKSQVSVRVLLCRARTRLARKLQDVAAEAGHKGPARRAGEKVSSKDALPFMKVEGI
jgi:RNA polymerase sigma-70 factor (ECF subfamily)